MPRRPVPGTQPGPATGPHPDSDSNAADATERSSPQVRRWAELIAEGRCPFPADWPAPDRDRLLVEVRLRLRARLVRFLARALASQIRHQAGPRQEDEPHA